MSPVSWPKVKYCVWQKEKGEQGTEHWQGYVQFSQNMRLAALKKMSPTAHWEERRGSHTQAKAYCMKEDTRVDGPWEHGVDQGGDSGQNGLTGVKRMIDDGASMKDIGHEHPSEVIRYGRGIRDLRCLLGMQERTWMTKTVVIWGPSGNGKTSLVQRCAPGAYWLSKPKPNSGVFFDGYDGQEDVVIDEFYGWIQHDLLCRMLDRTPLLVDTKGGMVSFCPKRVWITSNKDPLYWYKFGLGALTRRLFPPNGHIARFEFERLMTEDEMKERVDLEVVALMEQYPSWQEGERVLQSLLGPKVCEEHIEFAKEKALDEELEKVEDIDQFFGGCQKIGQNLQRINYGDDDCEGRIIARKGFMDKYMKAEEEMDYECAQRWDSDEE